MIKLPSRWQLPLLNRLPPRSLLVRHSGNRVLSGGPSTSQNFNNEPTTRTMLTRHCHQFRAVAPRCHPGQPAQNMWPLRHIYFIVNNYKKKKKKNTVIFNNKRRCEKERTLNGSSQMKNVCKPYMPVCFVQLQNVISSSVTRNDMFCAGNKTTRADVFK